MTEITFSPGLLSNKIILITGATRGIGRELAITVAKHGATAVILGKNIKKLNALYDEIMALQLPEPGIIPCNLAGAQPDDYLNIAKMIAENYGKLDGLVHNAATLGIKTEIIHYDILKWYETIQVNLNAVFLLTKKFTADIKISQTAFNNFYYRQ